MSHYHSSSYKDPKIDSIIWIHVFDIG